MSPPLCAPATLLIAILSATTAAHALDPGEQLADPALEARARTLAQELRCPVCQGETVDASDAGVARDLRGFLRARILAGDSDREALDAVVARFGESVLLRPDAQGMNLALWLAGPALFGAVVLSAMLRRRRKAAPPAEPPLSDAERSRLTAIGRKKRASR